MKLNLEHRLNGLSKILETSVYSTPHTQWRRRPPQSAKMRHYRWSRAENARHLSTLPSKNRAQTTLSFPDSEATATVGHKMHKNLVSGPTYGEAHCGKHSAYHAFCMLPV